MSDKEPEAPGVAPADRADEYNPAEKRRFKESFDPTGRDGGRPKGSRNRKTILREIAHEMHSVVEDGKPKRYSTLALVALKLRNTALVAKNTRAVTEFQRFVETYLPEARDSNVGYLVVPTPLSAEDWIAREEELNKTRKPPPGYEPRGKGKTTT